MRYLLFFILEILLIIQSLLHTCFPPTPHPELGSKCTELVRLAKLQNVRVERSGRGHLAQCFNSIAGHQEGNTLPKVTVNSRWRISHKAIKCRCRTVVFKVWSLDQQHYYHLGICQKSKFLGSTPCLLNKKGWFGAQQCVF